MTSARLWVSLMACTLAPVLGVAQHDTRSISAQGRAAVRSAEALARQIEARVNTAARGRSRNTPGILPRARAFYDVLKAEPVNIRADTGPALGPTGPTVTIAAQGTALLARPGGQRIAGAREGSKGTVLERQTGWYKVLLDTGAIGWLRDSAVAQPRIDRPTGPLTSAHYQTLAASISYPETASTAKGIRRMASGQVSSTVNRCAGSMAEALGWGLGDAHQWAPGLPKKGFTKRPSGVPPQPGDIVVWPFTFGRNRSQHVGFAVMEEGKVKLLSNLSGRIQLSPILPGYVTFAPP